MTDILEQWRSAKERWIISGEANEMIVGLETEIERLREALRYYAANHYPNVDDGPWGPGSNDFGDVARAALGEGEQK